MYKIILLLSIAAITASQVNAKVRRHKNNPFVTCGHKIHKLKGTSSQRVLDIADATCMRNPDAFDPASFANNNAEAICERKIRDTALNKASVEIIQLAKDTCLKDAQNFDGIAFLKTNVNAVCQRRIARLSTPGARASLLSLAEEKCQKMGVEFNGPHFVIEYNFCDEMAKRLTSLWTGFRRKARKDCILTEEPEKNFNEAEFIRNNIVPPLPGAEVRKAPAVDTLD